MNTHRTAGMLALASLGTAAWFSITLARADFEFRKSTPESVARAVQLAPRNSAYLSVRALQIEYNGGDSRPLLEEIVRINPDSSAPRIRLGLDAEVRGDSAGAERWLLEAASVDRQYEPRWTLANFYFRQQQPDSFWKWIHAALEISYGDRAPAFDLCWRVTQDPQAMMARAIPDQREVIAGFLEYLRKKDRVADAAPVAIRLSQFHAPGDLPRLYQELDALLIAHQRPDAREIWRNLGYPDPALVSNPDFGPPRIGHGFDWWLIQNSGVVETPLDTPPALRITFNGMQPESCELLKQSTGVHAGKRYLLRWESRGIASGIAWRAGIASAPLHAGNEWTPGQLPFTAAQDSDFIQLLYNRPLGEPRVEGSEELRHISLEERP